MGKIPTLVDGDLTLGDSKVICKYLEEAYPEPALYPREIADRARAHRFEDFAGGKLTELAAGIFFQRFMRPRAFKQEPDEALISDIIDNKLPPMLDYLEGQIPNEGFLFGESGIADLSIMSPLVNASYAGYEIDANRWPRTTGLIATVKARAEVKSNLEQEKAALGLSQPCGPLENWNYPAMDFQGLRNAPQTS